MLASPGRQLKSCLLIEMACIANRTGTRLTGPNPKPMKKKATAARKSARKKSARTKTASTASARKKSTGKKKRGGPARRTLLIGSMPFKDETEAMSLALRNIGDSLLCLPDGEIGEKSEQYPRGARAAWVMTAVDRCSHDTANWDVAQTATVDENGFPLDYDKVQKLRPKHSPTAMYPHLDFGYDRYFAESFPLFQKLRKSRGPKDLKFQVGIPTGLAIAMTMLQPLTALRYASVFNRRLAYETNRILEAAPEDVVVQIEVPAELALAYRLPNFLIGFALRGVFDLLEQLYPAGIGIHICFGDLNNKALIHADTLKKMVLFSNRLVNGWPERHRLKYVHYPLAEAATPPRSDAQYYAPLKDLILPQGTRFVAGLAHESHDVEQTQHILSIIESLRPEPIDIAASCGLGRRSETIAKDLIRKMAALSKTPATARG